MTKSAFDLRLDRDRAWYAEVDHALSLATQRLTSLGWTIIGRVGMYQMCLTKGEQMVGMARHLGQLDWFPKPLRRLDTETKGAS